MKNELKAFIHKTITSRKFWAALVACIPFATANDWNGFAMVWMTYAGIQGGVDAAEKLRKPEAQALAPSMTKTLTAEDTD